MSDNRENRYESCRKELGLTREQACELMEEKINIQRLVRIEGDKTRPHPEEVIVMAEKYKRPSLCNHYCTEECAIGQKYVPKIQLKELSSIVLEMLASLNSISKTKDRLIEIAVDDIVSNEEIDDFVFIQTGLKRISVTADTLQLWVEKMLADGRINAAVYNERLKKQNK